jgi:hypothetical protein
MSALLARLGLAESQVVSLSVLGRGNGRHVRGGRWCEQTRKTSWWKKSDDIDDRKGDEQFEPKSWKQKGEEQREASRKTSGFVRRKGWGIGSAEQEDTGERSNTSKQTTARQYGDEKLKRWQILEDTYNGTCGNEETPTSSARPGALHRAELGPTQQFESTFDRASHLADDLTEDEKASLRRLVDSQHDDSHSPSSESAEEQQRAQTVTPTPHINYEFWLPRAIAEKDQDKVARCLYAAQDCLDFDFLGSISETSFTDILHVLEARQNTQELLKAYRDIGGHMGKHIGLMRVDKFISEHSQMLLEVTTLRRRSGHRLTGPQYLILLRSAIDLGDSTLTERLWEGVHDDGVVPDIDMYNAYLGSFVWAGYNNAEARHRERVINVTMTARNDKRKDRPFANYHIGAPGGIKEKSMEILDAMLKSGISANEETYCSLITAAAREGEMDTVESVLRTVWDIDVNTVMQRNPGDGEVPEPKALSTDSPYYPTSKFLWTLAHSYGINNNIPAALRLVDYVARAYGITIDEDTWAVLFEWTFTLSATRSGTAARDDRKTGQLPGRALRTLFETMTGPPYFVKPTMDMYNRLIKNMSARTTSNRVLIEDMISRMTQAASLNRDHVNTREMTWLHLKRCLEQQRNSQEYPSIAVARRQWEIAAVTCSRNRQWMKRWVRLLLRSLEDWIRDREVPKLSNGSYRFLLHTVPRLLWDWRDLAGARVKYELPTGIVEIQMQTANDMLNLAVEREHIWRHRARMMDQAKVVVADELLVPSAEATTARGHTMLATVATTKRLRKARGAMKREAHRKPLFTRVISKVDREDIEVQAVE